MLTHDGRITILFSDIDETHAFLNRYDLFRSGDLFPRFLPRCFTEKAVIYNKCETLYYTETLKNKLMLCPVFVTSCFKRHYIYLSLLKFLTWNEL